MGPLQRPVSSAQTSPFISGFPTVKYVHSGRQSSEDARWTHMHVHYQLDCGLFKEDTSVLGHWPQSRLGQSKRRCLQKAENKESRQRATRAQSLSAQRARRFPLRPFLRAQVSALQELYNRENTEESEKHSTQTACLFSHLKQNTHPTSLPAALAKQRQPRAEGQYEN
jgi:hypothetical protein